ncbi:MAG: hypothetical protein JO034_20020 [Singulisphaera sp.]|nr:hypothetical protein [Planctomycetaceae bacterium]MBV8609730.1 hypothetical protein [Singulisphaera sp.]
MSTAVEHSIQFVRGQKTICIPCSQEQYERVFPGLLQEPTTIKALPLAHTRSPWSKVARP